jgi:hypothetical protein
MIFLHKEVYYNKKKKDNQTFFIHKSKISLQVIRMSINFSLFMKIDFQH